MACSDYLSTSKRFLPYDDKFKPAMEFLAKGGNARAKSQDPGHGLVFHLTLNAAECRLEPHGM